MSSALKVVYAGTPEFAVPALQALIDSAHRVVAVYTQPDRPAGRGRKLRPSPVKTLALQHDIPVEQPERLKPVEHQQRLASYEPDIMVVAAYGLILPKAVLDIPHMGCLNIHGSLLPRWRGAAPIHRAVLSGDAQTGVTIMQMAEGLDTGDMLLKRRVPITAASTTAQLHDQLASLGAEALLETMSGLQDGSIHPEVQDESLVTYAHKLSKAEAEIDWGQPAEELARQVMAFNPWPVAYTLMQGEPLRLWQALAVGGEGEPGTVLNESADGIDIATAQGALRVQRLQLPGGRQMSAQECLNGRTFLGQRFPS